VNEYAKQQIFQPDDTYGVTYLDSAHTVPDRQRAQLELRHNLRKPRGQYGVRDEQLIISENLTNLSADRYLKEVGSSS
jgi:hypothetical protein